MDGSRMRAMYLEGFEGGELDFALGAVALGHAGSSSGGREVIVDGSFLGVAVQMRR